MSIVSDEEVRSGTPRIKGTRITVLDVKRRVIDSGEDPDVVAGEYEISMAELFRALAYYYDHREQFESEERTYASARRAGEQRIQGRVAELAESGNGRTDTVGRDYFSARLHSSCVSRADSPVWRGHSGKESRTTV